MDNINIGKEFKKAIEENPLFLKYFTNLIALLEWHGSLIEELKTRNEGSYNYLSAIISRRQGVSLEELIEETNAIRKRLEDAD